MQVQKRTSSRQEKLPGLETIEVLWLWSACFVGFRFLNPKNDGFLMNKEFCCVCSSCESDFWNFADSGCGWTFNSVGQICGCCFPVRRRIWAKPWKCQSHRLTRRDIKIQNRQTIAFPKTKRFAVTFWFKVQNLPMKTDVLQCKHKKKQDEAHEPECRHVCWQTEKKLICHVSSKLTCETPWVHTLRWHSCRTPLLDTIAQRSGETLLLDSLVRHSCKTLLVWHSCKTLLLDIIVRHSSLTLLFDTLVRHSYLTLL